MRCLSILSGALLSLILTACTSDPLASAGRETPPPPPPAVSQAPAPTARPTPAPPPPLVGAAMPRPAASDASGELYPLWFGTNRKPELSGTVLRTYGTERDNAVHLGKVFVEIPRDYLQHLRGDSWLKKTWFKTDERGLLVRQPVPMDGTTFLADLQSELKPQLPNERVLLVYIHGFQTSFTEAAQRSASIGYQLKMPVTAFYSWPSKGAVAGYEADRNAAEASVDHLARFLIQMVRESGATKVHLIAHSMGNFALLQAMQRPLMQDALRTGLRFGQVILAAPDVDADVFTRDATVYARYADRVTLYASSKDLALKASSKLASLQRAGGLPPVTVVKGIDTLDVSEVNLTLLGHSYVADELTVLEDMHTLISSGQAPAKRYRVRPVAAGDYWQLR